MSDPTPTPAAPGGPPDAPPPRDSEDAAQVPADRTRLRIRIAA